MANQGPTQIDDCLQLPVLVQTSVHVRTGKGHCTNPVTCITRKACNDYINRLIELNIEHIQ